VTAAGDATTAVADIGEGPTGEVTQVRPAPTAVMRRRGDLIGRYVVLTPIGEGGMGLVYLAYDPELDRKVALKLLRPGGAGHGSAARLLREAQALARLADPNVVAVYDVGTCDDQVFVAMEFIPGATLSTWLKEQPRSQPEILAVFAAVGRGLAAAHRAGLVHRDLKPANIMIGVDGRARVMDFGLARGAGDTDEVDLEDALATPRDRMLAAELTRGAAVLGTPAYMAPEQWQRLTADARSDQFSFCVALWEALCGQRPFQGPGLAGLSEAVLLGRRQRPPDRARLPPWLRALLERGLAVAPEDRFPAMDALLVALDAGRRRGRRRRAWVPALALAALLAAGLGAAAWSRHRQHLACAAEAATLERDVWTAPTRTWLRDLLQRFDRDGEAVLARWGDPHVAAWRAARTELCELAADTDLAPEQLARARDCLDDAADRLAAVLEALRRSGTQSGLRVVPALAGLPAPGNCVDPRALARPTGAPDLDRARRPEARRALLRARSLAVAGDFKAGLAAAREVLAEIDAPGPLRTEAEWTTGYLASRTGDPTSAEPLLRSAAAGARALGLDDLEVDTLNSYAYVVGYQRARHDEATLVGDLALATLERQGASHSLRAATVHMTLATVEHARGDSKAALGRMARALTIREEILGPEHPEVALVCSNKANIHLSLGDTAAAEALLLRALGIHERNLGPHHPDLASVLNNLANVHDTRDDQPGAEALYRRALAIREQSLGPDHPDVAANLSNLAIVVRAQGRHAEALELAERSLTTMERAFGPDHPNVAQAAQNLASVHQWAGRPRDARAMFLRALTTWERTLAPDHPTLARPLIGLADLAMERRQPAEAARLLERAVTLLVGGEVDPLLVADTRMSLAEALAGKDEARAVAEARLAAAAYEAAGADAAGDLREARAWLAARPRRRSR